MVTLHTARTLRRVSLALFVFFTAAPVAAQMAKPPKPAAAAHGQGTPPKPTPEEAAAKAVAALSSAAAELEKAAASAQAAATVAKEALTPIAPAPQPAMVPDEKTAILACFAALETAEQQRTAARVSAEAALKTLKPNADCAAAVTEACTQAAEHTLAYGSEVLSPKHRRTCIANRTAGTTAGAATGATVASDVVQSIAQVVVTKAQAAGWQLLIDRLEELSHCPKKDGDPPSPTFPGTCKVLASLSLKDLVSSPKVLLDAVVADLLTDVENGGALALPGAKPAVSIIESAFLEASVRWPRSGVDGLAQAFRQAVMDHVMKAEANSCVEAPTIVGKYSYVVQMCLAQVGEQNFKQCPAQGIIDGCAPVSDDKIRAELLRLWDLTKPFFPAANARPVDAVSLAFALGQDELDDWENGLLGARPSKDEADRAQAYFDGSKALATGLATKDWVGATSGAVRILETLAKAADPRPADCDDKKDSCTTAKQRWDAAEVLRVLAAVGNYALTFDTSKNPDPGAAADARAKIITELVDRMVNRTDRQSGWVVSLGGTLGAIGGARFAKPDKYRADFAFPVQLTLGVGVQSYASSTGGFHALLSAIDLGQYVNMNDSGNLQVGSPDLKSALGFGATAGWWFALRETPAHVAAHVSINPFNRADGKPTYQAGLVVGIYVPLLDFN